jgi:hypothetical protein
MKERERGVNERGKFTKKKFMSKKSLNFFLNFILFLKFKKVDIVTLLILNHVMRVILN